MAFRPFRPSTTNAADLLERNDAFAALMPGVRRVLGLQAACARHAPLLFGPCTVLKCEAGTLIVAVRTSALAARLKQQLPGLLAALQGAGWPVQAVRLKLSMVASTLASPPLARVKRPFSNRAQAAFAELEQAIDGSPRNAALKAALASLLER